MSRSRRQPRYIFFVEAFAFNGGAGLKLAGKSVPVIISPGFPTMSFFMGPMDGEQPHPSLSLAP